MRWLLAAFLALPAAAAAQDSDQNVSNDPLTPLGAVQVQNYVQPFLNGQTGTGADQLNVRGVLPHEAFGLPQFARITLPVMASAWGPNGSATGIGDITIFDLFVHTIDSVRVGVGPLAVAPAASSPALSPCRCARRCSPIPYWSAKTRFAPPCALSPALNAGSSKALQRLRSPACRSSPNAIRASVSR